MKTQRFDVEFDGETPVEIDTGKLVHYERSQVVVFDSLGDAVSTDMSFDGSKLTIGFCFSTVGFDGDGNATKIRHFHSPDMYQVVVINQERAG